MGVDVDLIGFVGVGLEETYGCRCGILLAPMLGVVIYAGLVSLKSSSYPSPCFSYSSEIIVLGGGRGVWFASFSRKLSEPEDGRYRPKHVVLSLEWYLCCRLKPATQIPLQPNYIETPTHVEPRTIRPVW